MPLLYGGSRRLVLDYHRRAVALLDRAIVRLLPAVPKPVVQRLSSRYIAGPALDDAIRVVRKLNAKGKMATIDVLGEDVTNADEARAIAGQYHDVRFYSLLRDEWDTRQVMAGSRII